MYDIAPVILAIYIYSIKSSRTAPIPSMTYVDPQFTLRKKDDVTPCWRSLPLPFGSNGLLLERSLKGRKGWEDEVPHGSLPSAFKDIV